MHHTAVRNLCFTTCLSVPASNTGSATSTLRSRTLRSGTGTSWKNGGVWSGSGNITASWNPAYNGYASGVNYYFAKLQDGCHHNASVWQYQLPPPAVLVASSWYGATPAPAPTGRLRLYCVLRSKSDHRTRRDRNASACGSFLPEDSPGNAYRTRPILSTGQYPKTALP